MPNAKENDKPENPWTAHVKAYAAEHKMKYPEALKNADCKASYHAKKQQTA